MKTIVSLAGGAVSVTENAGVFSLNIDASLGGGSAAGVVKGQGSILLDAGTALKLGESLLNSHLPVSVQGLAGAVESIVNTAVASLE